MSFLDHIRACNTFNPSRAVPLLWRERRIGWLRHDNAAALGPFGNVFKAEAGQVRLIAEGDADAVSGAVDTVVDALVTQNRVPKWRNETFDVAARWGEPPIFRLDRGAVPFFGVRAYGVHLNGFRREEAGLRLWIGRRAADKRVAPDKLDNLVAGGIGSGYGAAATLVKEAEEEAGIAREIVARAVPVGAVSYRMETEIGIRDDVLFVYDLEVPPDFMPQNHDGEISRFDLMPAEEALTRVRETQDFKFNVNLIILDFCMRHGMLQPDDPELLELTLGLHRPFD